jgi:hypothetical protein
MAAPLELGGLADVHAVGVSSDEPMAVYARFKWEQREDQAIGRQLYRPGVAPIKDTSSMRLIWRRWRESGGAGRRPMRAVVLAYEFCVWSY